MDNLIKVFTGTEITVDLLKKKLEDIGIQGVIKNDFQSGIIAGFGGGTPSSIDLYIQENDMERAKSLIIEFSKINS